MRQTQWILPRGVFVFERAPAIMTIINVTPDSFSDGGQFQSLDDAWKHCQQALHDGARILDIGGESTRPGAALVSSEEEADRVVPLVEKIRQHSDALISIDTTKASVARAAMNAGADIINDISGMRFDPEMPRVAADTRAGVVLMHTEGERSSMHENYHYDDIAEDVWNYLETQAHVAQQAGVHPQAIIYDLGFGFAKSTQQNYELLARLPELMQRNKALLVGISRKRMIRANLQHTDIESLDHGSSVLHAFAARHGTQILRVHNTRAARAAIETELALHHTPPFD